MSCRVWVMARARCCQRAVGPAVILAVCLVWLPRMAAAFECLPLIHHAPGAVSYADSLLWEVRGQGQAPSFLFGTIHLAASAVGQPSPAVTQKLIASTQFGMEIVLDLDTMLQIGQSMRFQDEHRLSQVIGQSLFERTADLLSGYGVSRDAAEQLKPWAAFTTLSLPPGLSALPLDLVLLGSAQQMHKKIFGLETLAEQTAVFEQIALADQIALLTEVVCHHARLQRDTAALIAAYARGDLAALYRVSQQYESVAQDKLLDSLLTSRNRRMVARLKAPLAAGNAFVAIGALHLPGADGVLALLVAEGYRVRPLASQSRTADRQPD